ncbi:MAG: hypothetical protein PHR16_14415 [Methylovulum sp.]|nr:hypothetical protein [Methylovulum sp.]
MNKQIGAISTYDLSELQKLAQQQENYYAGVLIGLGNDGTQSVIVIDSNKGRPNKFVILKPTVAGVAIELPNHAFICKGTCFITGVKQELAAYRPQ